MVAMMYLSKTQKTSHYAWNRYPIDDTDLMSSVAYAGRELIFTIDTELLRIPTMNPDNNQVLFKYLRDMSTNSQFAISVLQIRTEERITSHRERWNKGRQILFSK